jgi:antitoxin component HigA of HigAB toxin-antitoxin module
MEEYTVIPFNFGTVYLSEESLHKFVVEYSDSLIENFLFVEWKEEWTIRMYSNQEVLREEIDNLSTEAADLEKLIMSSSPGKAFLLSRKKAILIENEISKLNKYYGSEYYDEIKKHSVSTVFNNLIPKEFTGRNDDMILNATFLVNKDQSVNFVSNVRLLNKKYNHLGFDSEITGPWPPFSFISIKENK